MAADLGARSLAGVHEEGLDELLHELATFQAAGADHEPAQPLGVPILDTLLHVFMSKPTGVSSYTPIHGQSRQFERPEQSAEDEEMLFQGDVEEGDAGAREAREQPLLAHRDANPAADSLIRRGARHYLPVVEIASDSSAAGKSQLLYYLTALAVLPSTYSDIPVGGHDAAVVYIDADGRFDSDWLRVVARGIVQQRQSQSEHGADRDETPADDLESLLVSCLQHVHVFRPQSSPSLLATLRALDAYLFDLSRHRSAPRRVHMLALDSATAFFWQDRLRDEVARTENIGRPRAEIEREREQKQSFYLSDLYAEVVRELKRLQSRLGCAIAFTTTIAGGRAVQGSDPHRLAASGPFDPSAASGLSITRSPSLRPALPAPWGTFPTLRLVVHRDSVRPFPPTMSASDAEKEAPLRQAVVHQGKFSAWVNAWGREEWPRRVVDGVAARNGGTFSFHVRGTGVEIPDLTDESMRF